MNAFGRGRSGRRIFPNVLSFEVGPWIGARDLIEPTAGQRNLVTSSRNMYVQSAELGGAIVGRPGFNQADTTQQLGVGSTRRCQLFDEFVKLDGTRHRIAVCGGLFYTWDPGTGLFTARSMAPFTLSATANVYGLAFADRYIVTDGIAKPIAWDGTTFSELSASPVLYGQPWSHYAKLFGIKAAERSTLVWSEEADPTIGYEAGGFNNAWTLGQTDQNPLTAGVGFNEAMVIFRARSMTQITGAVTPEFQSSGTREGISETIGTTTPGSLVVVGRTVFFLDADGRPQRYILSGGIEDEPAVWESATEQLRDTNRLAESRIIGGYHPEIDVVLWAIPAQGSDDPSYLMAFDGSSGRYLGIWTGFPLTALGFWSDQQGNVRMVHGEVDGRPYLHGVPRETVYDDGFQAGAMPVEHVVITGPIGYDATTEKQFDRVDLSVLAETNITDCRIRLTTPRGVTPEIDLEFLGGEVLWDEATWDVSLWSVPSLEQHGAVGTAAAGRWCRVEIRHKALGETFGLLRCAVQGFGLGTYPETP